MVILAIVNINIIIIIYLESRSPVQHALGRAAVGRLAEEPNGLAEEPKADPKRGIGQQKHSNVKLASLNGLNNIYIYIYIYMYTHVYIYIYIHIYMYVCV